MQPHAANHTPADPARPAARVPRPGRGGYCGIGVEGVSKSANVGALLRTAHAFGAAFCFTVGAGYDSRAARRADTADTRCTSRSGAFPTSTHMDLPQGCVLVGVELLDDAAELPSFRHPLNAAYVLGPERSGLSPALLARCRHIVRIPTRFALNLAVAGRAGAVRPAAPARPFRRPAGGERRRRAGRRSGAGHGDPVFRRTCRARSGSRPRHGWSQDEAAKRQLVGRACPRHAATVSLAHALLPP